MKTLETNRLILRKLCADDFEAVQSYASVAENVRFMPFGPNSEEQTRAFISRSIESAEKDPCTDYQYAVILKESGHLIGACGITVSRTQEGEVGWILHHDSWKQGYGSELAAALLAFGFADLGLHRIVAHCDADNIGSYRVMEKNGMRREGLFIQSRPPKNPAAETWHDELSYAILASEWTTICDLEQYLLWPVVFDDFIDVPILSDGEIEIACIEKKPADPDKNFVPGYGFEIRKNCTKIGRISLRIGYSKRLYYGGNIGYYIDDAFRGNGYAVRACHLLTTVMKAHGMKKIIISNDILNEASKRVCEKLGAHLEGIARIPEWHDMYQDGIRSVNIFKWDVA